MEINYHKHLEGRVTTILKLREGWENIGEFCTYSRTSDLVILDEQRIIGLIQKELYET